MDLIRHARFLPGRVMTPAAAPATPLVRGEPLLVSDGVYVIPDNHVPIVPNIGIVVGTCATLVIDTGLGQNNGAYVLEHASRLGSGRPVYMATTHVDPGHGFGMAAFKRNARIVFHQSQVEEMHRHGRAYIETSTRLRPELESLLLSVEFVEPGEMVLPDGRAITPTGKSFDVEFGQTTKWVGDQLIIISAFWDANLVAKQIGLA
jgi:glyoxylase-like metal-dependent hydrolase (beta-lactamase superfamily II)